MALLLVLLAVPAAARAGERIIAQSDLLDKLAGYWIGQLAGNYLGLPFENLYRETPCPVTIDRYLLPWEAGAARTNARDMRGYTALLVEMAGGAYSDDDTDIEFVTLHALEKYGLGLTYPQIAEMWRAHVNRGIWLANRRARDLLDRGWLPPVTGARTHNPGWFQIDAQLVNEIWGAIYPGMTAQAIGRADWGAHISNDDWGTHPARAYAAMYSAAFFEADVERLVALGLAAVPQGSPFAEGMRDVIRWHRENPDWRVTRALIHTGYYRYRRGDVRAPVSVSSALVNGLCGVMALLYGGGDFSRTVAVAVSAGYDCDNQAATCGGLVGVLHGAMAIPDRFTREFPGGVRFAAPFNDRYLNYTRDGLPTCTPIHEIVVRLGRLAELAILQGGGRKFVRDGREYYAVRCDF